MKIGLSQINVTVGDIEGNLKKISKEIDRAKGQECDLVIFPELSLTGYPPEDLLLKSSFVTQNINALHSLASSVKKISAIVGFVDEIKGQRFNAAALI